MEDSKKKGELVKFQNRPKTGTHRTDICGQYSSYTINQDEYCCSDWRMIFQNFDEREN